MKYTPKELKYSQRKPEVAFKRFSKMVRGAHYALSHWGSRLSLKDRLLANAAADYHYRQESLTQDVSSLRAALHKQFQALDAETAADVTMYACARFRNLLTYEGLALIEAHVVCDAKTKRLQISSPLPLPIDRPQRVQVPDLIFLGCRRATLSTECRHEIGCTTRQAFRDRRKAARKAAKKAAAQKR